MCIFGIVIPKNDIPGIVKICTSIFATRTVSNHRSIALITQLNSPKVIILRGNAISCKRGLRAKERILRKIPPIR